MMKIIFPFEGGISVLYENDSLPIQEMARRDVPHGVPYLIIDDADIPSDRNSRAAWEADFSNPDGYGIGNAAWHAEQSGSGK